MMEKLSGVTFAAVTLVRVIAAIAGARGWEKAKQHHKNISCGNWQCLLG